MNEQIRELMQQADSLARAIEPDLKEVVRYNRIRDEKFAELIVRKCVSICKDIDGEDNIDARSGRQDCAVEIREHFGVEL